MKEFILFMYNDANDPAAADDGGKWDAYFASWQASGRFDGGSSIGAGLRIRKGQADVLSSSILNGFIRVRAGGIEEARAFLIGNPVYEAGGTVEIRELPTDGDSKAP
jgi:hypothetical protein